MISSDKNILVAAMPKSASTFLSEMISSSFGYRRAYLVPVHSGREQELDFLKLETYQNIFNFNIDRTHWVAQHHVKYSRATEMACLQYNVFPIVLVRNILDNLRSQVEFSQKTHDHKRPQYENFIPEFLIGQPEEKIKEYTIYFHLPWIISFIKSWTYANRPHARLEYELVTKKTAFTIEKIMKICAESKYKNYNDKFQIRKEIQEIANKKIQEKSAIRFNKGISSRGIGDYFSAEQIEIINNICSVSVDKKMYEGWSIWDGLSFTPN